MAKRRIFVGVRVNLAKASAARVGDLIEDAWRKALKRLVVAYDEAGGQVRRLAPGQAARGLGCAAM